MIFNVNKLNFNVKKHIFSEHVENQILHMILYVNNTMISIVMSILHETFPTGTPQCIGNV